MELEIERPALPAVLSRTILGVVVLYEVIALGVIAVVPNVPRFAAIAVLVAPLLPFVFFKSKNYFVFLLFLMIVIPIEGYRKDPIPFGLTNKVLWAGLFIVLSYWLVGLSLRRFSIPANDLDILVLLFFLLVFIAIFTGLLAGHRLGVMANELAVFFYLGVYFFVRSTMRDRSWSKVIVWLMIAAAIIVSLEYQLIVLKGSTGLGFGSRVQARQEIVYLIGFAFLLAYVLLSKSRRIRLLLTFLIPLLLVGATISQTRAVWISLGVILFVESLVCFAVVRERKQVLRRLFPVLMVILATLAVGLVVMVRLISPSVFFQIASRFLSIGDVANVPSVMWRMATNQAVIEKIMTHPFFGSGLGSMVSYRFWGNRYATNWVDNSYLALLWKLGVFGLVVYISIVLLVLKRAFFLFRKHRDLHGRVLALGVIGLYSGLIIWGIASAVFVKYRFNLVWAVLIALIQMEYEDVRSGDKELR